MAALTGNSIDSSYQGLIKTTDNGAISGTAKAVTDGLGNATNIEISNTATNFVSGTVDFTGSTVSGLPGGAAGLVAGTGTDSMKSADALTTNAATSSGNGTIAIGNGANASGTNGSIAIGEGALADGDRGIAIGEGAGYLTGADSRGVCIGYNTGFSGGTDIVSIGYNSTAKANGSISFGDSARVDNSSATDAIAMGNLTTITAAVPGAVNINTGTLTAGIENTVSVKALATVVDSTATAGGILMSDAGGTDRRINIDATGKLYIDNTAVSGGGGAAGLENGSGADSLQSAAALTTNAANASGAQSIALGDGATAPGSNAIAIGKGADTGASSNEVIVIGNSTGGTAASESIRIGHDIPGSSFSSNNVAIGNNFDSVAGSGNVMIGNSASSASDYNTLVGHNTTALFQNGVAIGRDATAGNQAAVIAIGYGATGGAFAGAIALGRNTEANANAAVALGDGVIAATADTVSVKALETQTDSTPTAGGIIMSDAGGTDRRLNIDANGILQVDSNAVGAATTFNLPRTTGTSTSGCDVIYSSVLIPANTFAAGDILQLSGAMSASNSASTIWSAYWISTNGTVGGNATEEVNMGQLALSDTNWAIGFQKNLYVNVANGTGAGTELVTGMGYTDVDGNVNTAGIQSYTPDWTSDLYLVNRTCIQTGNTGVTYVDHGAVLKKIN